MAGLAPGWSVLVRLAASLRRPIEHACCRSGSYGYRPPVRPETGSVWVSPSPRPCVVRLFSRLFANVCLPVIRRSPGCLRLVHHWGPQSAARRTLVATPGRRLVGAAHDIVRARASPKTPTKKRPATICRVCHLLHARLRSEVCVFVHAWLVRPATTPAVTSVPLGWAGGGMVGGSPPAVGSAFWSVCHHLATPVHIGYCIMLLGCRRHLVLFWLPPPCRARLCPAGSSAATMRSGPRMPPGMPSPVRSSPPGNGYRSPVRFVV